MGLESAPQNPLGRLDPSMIVAKPDAAVTPSAVDMLSNAVRQGFITAEDIKSRIQNDPAAREKANLEIMLAKEGQSPEAQKMRSNQRNAASAQAGGAAAIAPLEQTAAEATLKAAILDAQLKGSGVADMQQALVKAGWAVTVDPSKGLTESDQKEIQRRFQVLLNFVSEKAKADALDKDTEVKNPEIEITDASGATVKGPSNTPVINYKGQMVPVEKFKQLQQYKATMQGMTPAMFDALGQPKAPSLFGEAGEIQPAAPAPAAVPVAAAPAAAPASIPILPKGPARSQEEAIARDRELTKLLPNQIQSKAAAKPVFEMPAAPSEATPGQPFGPLAMVTGQKSAAAGKGETPRESAAELGRVEEDLQAVAQAKQIIGTKDLNVVGPGAGSQPVKVLNQIGAALGFRGKEFVAQDKLLQAVNKRVLEGAQQMKGNLSDKDIRFLKESYPTLSSDESVWTDFLNKWEQMLRLNQQVIRGTAPKGASIFDQASAATPSATPAASAPQGQMGPVITLSTGKRVQRGPDGQYYPAP